MTGSAWAEDEACTVKQEDVKTWVATIDGKDYQVRPATPAYDGDTGLFHLSSAYTLPKGKVSFSLYRDNLDRDPKDLDISTHGAPSPTATDRWRFSHHRDPEPATPSRPARSSRQPVRAPSWRPFSGSQAGAKFSPRDTTGTASVWR